MFVQEEQSTDTRGGRRKCQTKGGSTTLFGRGVLREIFRIPHFTIQTGINTILGGSQKGGFQKGGFGRCSPGTKTGTRVRSPKPPFWKPPFYLPITLFGVDKRVVSKRVVSADVPPQRKPERGYVRQNHPFTKPPFYLPVKFRLPGIF